MRVRIWLEDEVQPQGGIWCYGYVNEQGLFCPDINDHPEDRDTIEQYLEWGYKIEKL